MADRKYTGWIESCCGEELIEPSTFISISRIILEELVKDGIVVSIPAAPEYTVYALDKNKVYISDDVTIMKCNMCGHRSEDGKTANPMCVEKCPMHAITLVEVN